MKKSNLTRALCVVLAVILVVGCSFAYFTDYATEQATGTAGTVALSMDSNINLLDADGQDIINPGDQRDAGFTVTNEGNKSIDVRTTIVLTTQSNIGYDLLFSGEANTQSEYDLYLRNDVELVEGKGYVPKDGAQPLQVKSIDQDVITYILPEYSLNGNSDRYDEVESIDGVNAFSRTEDIVFVMKGAAGNEWQNSSVSIDILVEAKQHENTSAGWEIVAKENIVSGAINQEAVKGENVITENALAVVNVPVASVDENGNSLNAKSTLIKGAEAETLLNSLEASGLANKDDVDLLINVEADDFTGTATTTFDVSQIAQDGDTVAIFHYDEESGEWEHIATEIVVDGKVSGSFSSYSPVAFDVISKNEKEKVSSDYIVHNIALYMIDDNYNFASKSAIADDLIAEFGDVLPDIFYACPYGQGRMPNKSILLMDVNDPGNYGTHIMADWTGFELVSEDESTITIKLISDVYDYSELNLEYANGLVDDVINGFEVKTLLNELAIEGTNLTWTHTFTKK